MRPSSYLRATACAVLLAFTPACSAIFVSEATLPTHTYADEGDENLPDCTQVQVAPALDGAVAAVGVLAAVIGTMGAFTASSDDIGGKEYPAIVGGIGALVALTFGLSAKYGFEATNECRELHEPLKKIDHALATGSARAAQHADFMP